MKNVLITIISAVLAVDVYVTVAVRKDVRALRDRAAASDRLTLALGRNDLYAATRITDLAERMGKVEAFVRKIYRERVESPVVFQLSTNMPPKCSIMLCTEGK